MLHHYLVQSATIGTVLQSQHLTGAGTPWFNNFFHESIANAHALFAHHTTVLAKAAKCACNSQVQMSASEFANISVAPSKDPAYRTAE
jgi:hypothetical protein